MLRSNNDYSTFDQMEQTGLLRISPYSYLSSSICSIGWKWSSGIRSRPFMVKQSYLHI